MLTADQTDGSRIQTASFCWSCGVPDPGGDPCGTCGVSAGPKTLSHSELIGATASIRQKFRNRPGIVVAKTPASALLAFPDASVAEAPVEKLIDIEKCASNARSSAWTLVSKSRAIKPIDRREFDELISSFVLALVNQSVDEARRFALDALDADCPAWLDKIHLTTTERDFLFASYHADRGDTAVALERLLRLPEDRYPTKDLVFLRCIRTIQATSRRTKVRQQLQPFSERPIASTVLNMLDGGDLDDEIWLRSSGIVLSKASSKEEVSFPRALTARFMDSISSGSPLPDGSWELGAETRIFALAQAVRSGGPTPQVTLADLLGMPDSLIDDAIELGALTVSSKEREYPLARYVLARTDPDVLAHGDLVELNYDTELARRAFLQGDRKALESLPRSPATDQLKVLDSLRSGDFQRAIDGVEAFEGQAREKVESITQSLAQDSIDAASNEVLTDGTTWPILGPLLPGDTSTLNDFTEARPALRGIAAWRALSGAVSRLWDWDWEGALVDAKRCLLVAKDEQTRDEALNIIACAEWQLGDDPGAIAALSSALEGNYTEGLQVNIGVVAGSLDPQLAGEHLGRLAVEAPTLRLRLAAASRALGLWFADPDPWETQESDHALPARLRDALRTLVRSDIDEASFVRLARTMSTWDEEWFGKGENLSGSPFEGSTVVAVYQAKARDFGEFVKALVSVVAREDPPEWAMVERDGLVGSAIAALNPQDANPMAASFGLLLIDSGLPMEAGIHVDLVGFTVVAVCEGIDPTKGEPQERFLDMVVQARSKIAEVPTNEQERSNTVLDFASSKVIGSIAAARANQYDQVVNLYNDLALRLRGVPSHQINRGAVRSGTQSAVDFLSDTARMLERLVAYTSDPDFKSSLSEFRNQVRQLLSWFNQVRGS